MDFNILKYLDPLSGFKGGFDAARVRAALSDYPFKKLRPEFHFFDVADSTQDELRMIASRDNAAEGAMAMTLQQTSGRGRDGRSWVSPAGKGLYLSLLLRPGISPEKLGHISLLGGLAVVHALEALTPLALRLKWPNDILCNRKKIAGVLMESSLKGGTVDYVLVGTGINVSQEKDDFTGIAAPFSPTSVLLEAGPQETAPLEHFALELYSAWDTLYDAYLSEGYDVVKTNWERFTHFRHEGRLTLKEGENIHEGRYGGLDDLGRLILENEDGSKQAFAAGEVTVMQGE